MMAYVTGGAWIGSEGQGLLSEGRMPALAAGPILLPKARDLFEQPPTRYGRFDQYTKLGCACVALALQDAALKRSGEEGAIGIVSSSSLECLETDCAFYATTTEEGAMFASPNLFSYTLPGIMLGECAVLHRLTGPAFCVGDDEEGRGLPALSSALRLMEDGMAETMLAGWIDSIADATAADLAPDFSSGAAFVVLQRQAGDCVSSPKRIQCDAGTIRRGDGAEVKSILDLFA
jgi:3-oxoacyl-(acyl-carrier-protein) synthase